LVEPPNQGGGGFPGLGLKTGSYGLVIWGLKITVMVSSFGPQNQAGFNLSVAPENRWEDEMAWDTRRDPAACLTWNQVWLEFPSLVSRLAEARRWVVHVVPSRRLHRSHVEDGWVDAMGCIGPCYPCFGVFILLSPRGIVVI
jgi:hypothetical protein